jgi:hypothetical protein
MTTQKKNQLFLDRPKLCYWPLLQSFCHLPIFLPSSLFFVEDEGSKILRNVATYLQNHTASHPEMSLPIYQTTPHHIPKYSKLNIKF